MLDARTLQKAKESHSKLRVAEQAERGMYKIRRYNDEQRYVQKRLYTTTGA